MSMRCPDGHISESTDYCDVCGLPMSAAPAPAPAAPTPTQAMPTEKSCPNCQSVVPEADLFCEVCGYDFTTGALPAPVTAPGGVPVQHGSEAQVGGPAVVTPGPGGSTPPVPAPTSVTWVAEVWVDPDWFGTQESDEAMPSAGMPVILPLWDSSVLIGRKSVSRNIHPQIDCGSDHGVSRRHAQLTTDGQRWWAEDLQSSNGTFISPAGAPLPSTPIPVGQRVEFAPGDRVFVGAWTRVVVRRATSDES
jgi:FHA domain-containing protein